MKFSSAPKFSSLVKKLHWKEILALLFILVAVYFFRQQHRELRALVPALKAADQFWIMYGISVTMVYLFLQALMYYFCFRTVGSNIPLWVAAELFLKRNFISVFLPAGGISSLSFRPKSLSQAVTLQKQIFQASGIYAFVGILTVFLITVPVLFIMGGKGNLLQTSIKGSLVLIVLLAALILAIQSLRKKGKLYQLITRLFPSWRIRLEELFSFNVGTRNFVWVIIVSLGIELCGIIQLYMAMGASGSLLSISAACAGYVVATIFLVVSPFMRGMGAVELSLTYTLTLLGYDTLHAVEITILFRIFEFWLPLLAGLIAFVLKGRNILLRISPALLIFALGIVNIFTVLIRKPVNDRLLFLKNYLPVESIHASGFLVVFMGLILLVTAAFLLKGLRTAWLIALILSILSAVSHFTRQPEFREGLFASGVALVLIFTARQYRLKNNPRLVNLGMVTAASIFVAVIVYGFVGFYFLDVKHFGIDFSWRQSLVHTIRIFFLGLDYGLKPLTRFGGEFLVSIRLLGFGAWGFFFYTVIRPYIRINDHEQNHLERAKSLVEKYGSSAVDYFKINDDKLFYFAESCEGFIAYRIANGFAIVLEEPVCAPSSKLRVIREFEQQCGKMGLKPAFYRVDEVSMNYFDRLRRKKLLIGQEAIMEVEGFSLEGREKKSLRNALNSLQKKGFTIATYYAPLETRLIEELRRVSDQWLKHYKKKEMVFSQGKFEEKTIRNNDVIVVKEPEGNIVAFLNIIPDYAPDECTYDLIRKTADAPGGCMDALIVELIKYTKQKNLRYLNLGMVPLAGILEPGNAPEQLVKFAFEKIKRFRHYRGLREFKEKYATRWLNKYLVYENDFDLMQLPAALNKVMQPKL